MTKHDLLTSAELKTLGGSPSKLAALDYLVCLYAEVFVQTLGGNMGHSLRVHRSYLGRYSFYPNRCGIALTLTRRRRLQPASWISIVNPPPQDARKCVACWDDLGFPGIERRGHRML